jgi:hypothetical protein
MTEQHARGVLVEGNGGGYAGQDVLVTIPWSMCRRQPSASSSARRREAEGTPDVSQRDGRDRKFHSGAPLRAARHLLAGVPPRQ